ncbi:hypothetical protein KPH14_008906 [Odynerus spinipes]|uniref:Uncharacterized protein n=1 Tax=Odynerus spinipes TaxID=1348599 RepID=A0AAD9RN63_9HYME|nr:hypothetical protein KPH14_008906 [Odynerus spinipes]
MSSLDYLDLCRLCLVKDHVSVPIFEGEGDVRQIFLKITACLPVKVDREDKLPKKICDDCVYKVELFYQFWNTTVNAEKQLLQWLGEVGLEEKPDYVTSVLNQNVMKPDPSDGNRLDGSMMQQVSGHQNNMVPMDTSGSSVQTVQEMPGTSDQSMHEQITQSQTSTSNQQEEEEESSEEENSEDECDGEEGLPVKEESEEDPNNSRAIEPTTFVNVSLACDEAGPSGLQQQKIAEMPEMAMPQNTDGDPKSGEEGGGGNGNDGGGGETFGGLSGMLRQILSPSPSPETGESGMPIGCNFLQTNSIFSNQSSMMQSTLQTIPSHLSMIYPDQGNLLMDQSQLILPESHPCPTCGLEFRSVLKLNYHVKTSHPRRPEYEHQHHHQHQQHQQHQNVESTARYSCSVCPRSFFVLTQLRMHEMTHEMMTGREITHSLASSSNLSSSSGRGTSSNTGLISGMAMVSTGSATPGNTEKTFGCDRCQASFRYRTLLERHRRMHEVGQEKPYSCPRCLMRFETRNLYNHHAKTHKPSIEANDRLVSDGNPVSLAADRHHHPNLTVTTGTTNPPVVVGPPSAAAIVAAAAVNAANKSLTTTSYPCDSCSKQFATIESLTSHKAVHRSRPLVCDVCGKGFTHRKYYVVHQRIHTGERPYLCAMCGKSFTQASTLTVHRRYHTGERPYTCTLCGKGFVTRTIMLNHMKKH